MRRTSTTSRYVGCTARAGLVEVCGRAGVVDWGCTLLPFTLARVVYDKPDVLHDAASFSPLLLLLLLFPPLLSVLGSLGAGVMAFRHVP